MSDTFTNPVKFLLFLLASAKELYRYVRRKLQVSLFHQKMNFVEIFGESSKTEKKTERILIIITHITSVEETQNIEKASHKLEKLSKTIEGITVSFAQYNFQILINTLKNRHITQFLPEYQRNLLKIVEQQDCDPMYVGFKTQDEFIKRINEFDWFIYLEDDIVINDSCFLEKVDFFNKRCLDNKLLLIPNRYEMYKGAKNYIDLVDYKWNKLSVLKINNVIFSECQNPHAGLYCLSKSQLEQWIESGRTWCNEVTFVGPLESASTGCLYECFSLYKPHLENLHFLEVRHWDTKYSKMLFN